MRLALFSPLSCVLWSPRVWCQEPPPRIHLVTFTSDPNYQRAFEASLTAKEEFAAHWGYSWEVFNDNTIDCDQFRPFRWRGDFRYCKLQALKTIWSRVRKLQKSETQLPPRRDYIFWHDVDTHMMKPEIPLTHFLERANYTPMVFTENALSLNNGVFFLQVDQGPAKRFFSAWRKGCRQREWPWADNGCMYEVLLQLLGGEQYRGSCRRFSQESFNESQPEPLTGEDLMNCFNSEMSSLGLGCCDRKLQDFAFLTGEDSFNHHPCEELLKKPKLQEFDRTLIRSHCFKEGMFMVHSKNLTYAQESLRRVRALKSEL
ncbi:unnamed protein product [Durusdinium trenchii]|uniref:Uncharacterized protein n=2 Tax=Durusdinium trenchii TaxID=1381693 RepID=A0ABP0PAC5_9DINO